MRAASACARATSRCIPASGATATGSGSRRAAARSSTAARTRRSTARACAWARARSTARRRAVEEVLDALVVDVPRGGADGELRMMLFVVLRDGVHARRGARRRGSSGASARTARRATCPTRSCQIEQVPRTLSGKVLEVPVKRILMGAAAGRGRERRLARRPALARLLRRARRDARSGPRGAGASAGDARER